MANETLLFFDVETTGINPETSSVIEIGAVAFQNGKKLAEFQGTCKPYNKEVNIGALAVNRVTPEKLHTLGDSQKLANDFVNFLLDLPQAYRRSIIPAAHNIGFDFPMIDNFLKAHNVMDFESYVSYRKIDTFPIAQFLIDSGILPSEKGNLQAVAKVLDIGYDSDKHHTALYDAELCAKAYFAMIDLVKDKKGLKAERKWG